MATHAQSSELQEAIRKVLLADLGEVSRTVLLRHLAERYGIDLDSPEEVSFDELEDALCDVLGNAGRLVMDHVYAELRQ